MAWNDPDINGRNVTLSGTFTNADDATARAAKDIGPLFVEQIHFVLNTGPAAAWNFPLLDANLVDVMNGNSIGLSNSANTLLTNADLANGIYTRGALTVTAALTTGSDSITAYVYAHRLRP